MAANSATYRIVIQARRCGVRGRRGDRESTLCLQVVKPRSSIAQLCVQISNAFSSVFDFAFVNLKETLRIPMSFFVISLYQLFLAQLLLLLPLPCFFLNILAFGSSSLRDTER